MDNLSTSTTARAGGMTSWQLESWKRANIIGPSIDSGRGCGSRRLWSREDALLLRLLAGLADVGMSTRKLHSLAPALRRALAAPASYLLVVADTGVVHAACSPGAVITKASEGKLCLLLDVEAARREVEAAISEECGSLEMAAAR